MRGDHVAIEREHLVGNRIGGVAGGADAGGLAHRGARYTVQATADAMRALYADACASERVAA